MRIAPLVLALAIGLQPSCSPPPAAARPLNLQINQILNWFPANTESIVATTEPGQALEQESRNGFGPLAGIIDGLVTATFPKELQAHYTFAIDGSRNFVGPKSLGLGHHEGCTILGLDTSESQKEEQAAKQKSLRKGTIGGFVAYVFEHKDPAGDWTFYCVFDKGLLFCATDKGFLKELLNRRAQAAPRAALPETLEEWRQVDVSAPFWAVHHVSPLIPAKFARAMKKYIFQDDQVVGCTMCLEPSKKRLNVVVISDNPHGYDITKAYWTGYLHSERGTPPLEVAKLDARTTKIVLDAQAPKGMIPALVLYTYVGHIIAI